MQRPLSSQKPDRGYLLLYLVCFFSLGYLAYLAASIHTGVFFSSDGGMKFLALKQFVEGHGFKYLHLPQPGWVHDIWEQDFFPFRPPHMYPSPNGYLFTFPPAFQIISSFFYSRFGYVGLYILPLLSTVLLWLFIILLLKRCGITPNWIAITLFILVFCSPLTIYGSTYWEHMPAMLLLLSGLAYIVNPPSGKITAFTFGFVSGLAVWLRPEALLMNVLYGFALAILYFKKAKPAYLVFITGMFLSVAGFLVFNKIEFGSFLGIHGYQVVQDNSFSNQLSIGIQNLKANNLISVRHFLFVLILIPVLYTLFISKNKLDLRSLLLVFIILAYCLITPFFVPNDGGRQWGARYFLPIIPVTLVALLLIGKQWKLMDNRRFPFWLTVVIILFIGYSFQRNTYSGGIKTLRWENYNRISPTLNFLNRQHSKVVIVSFPYIAMETAYLFDQKYYFLAPDDSSLHKLLPLLKNQGIHDYTYIYDKRVPDNLPHMLKDTSVDLHHTEKGDFYFANYTIH